MNESRLDANAGFDETETIAQFAELDPKMRRVYRLALRRQSRAEYIVSTARHIYPYRQRLFARVLGCVGVLGFIGFCAFLVAQSYVVAASILAPLSIIALLVIFVGNAGSSENRQVE